MAPSAWVIVTCASIASLNCGTLYFFGAFSPQVASQLRYTAAQTSRIAIAGQSATILAGPPCGHVIDAVGFTIPAVLGSLAIWLGYFLFYKQYSSAASNLPYSCFLFALIGVGSTGLSSACVKSSMLAWPARKGLAVALPLACYGASGIFFSSLGSWLTPGDTAALLKMVASVTFGIGLATAPVLCVYDWRRPRAPAANVAASIEMQVLSSPRPVLRHTEKPHALRTPEFWMVTAALGLLAGIGQMYIYGLGMIVCSLYALPSQTQQALAAYDVAVQEHQHAQVSLLSLCSTGGRLLGGLVADEFHARVRRSRTYLLLVPATLIGAVQIGGIFSQNLRTLSFLSVGLGLGYGSLYTLTPLVVSDLWGVTSFSTNWGLCNLTPVVTNLVLSTLFARNYDLHTENLEISGETRRLCMVGHRCYNGAFWGTLGLAVVACGFLWALVSRQTHYTPLQKEETE
ncbi:hypothetical protein KL938_003690 [Ogataea parapolymorpha]|nr:hypothetical protein KL938_003690 [Ogataea parapolymorpha]